MADYSKPMAEAAASNLKKKKKLSLLDNLISTYRKYMTPFPTKTEARSGQKYQNKQLVDLEKERF